MTSQLPNTITTASTSVLTPFASARLTYRAPRPADLPVFAQINADPFGYQNSNASNTHLPRPADAESFLKSTAEDYLLGAVIWLPPPTGAQTSAWDTDQWTSRGCIVDPVYGVAVGQIHLSRLPPRMAHHRCTELGIDILPVFQGQGYGAEAIQWALRYAFEAVGLHRVRVRAFGWNEGAVRLYRRLGFREEGREREALWHEGRFWDGVELGMLEGEWREIKERDRGEGGS